jgi:hypothetical protein
VSTRGAMGAEGNNKIRCHGNLLLSVAPIITNAEEVAVKVLEALGCGVTRYTAELANDSGAPIRVGFCTRRSSRRLRLVTWRRRASIRVVGRSTARLTIGSSMSSSSV